MEVKLKKKTGKDGAGMIRELVFFSLTLDYFNILMKVF